MKNLCLLAFLLFTTYPALAQMNDLYKFSELELKKKLAESQDDTGRVRIQVGIGRSMLYRSGGMPKTIDSAMLMGVEIENDSRRLNYNYGIINGMVIRTLCFYRQGQKTRGIQLAKQTLILARSVRDNNGIAEAYIGIADQYSMNIPSELKIKKRYYEHATDLFRKEANLPRLAATLEMDGELCYLSGEKAQAVKLLTEALNINKSIGKRTVQGIYWMIARTSNNMGDYTDGVKYSLLAIRTAEAVGDSTLKLCSIYHNLATTYINLNDYRQALVYSLKALQIARRFKDVDYILTVEMAAAMEYTHLGQFQKSLSLMEEMERSAVDITDSIAVAGSFVNNLTRAKQFKKAGLYAKKLTYYLSKISIDNYNQRLVPYNFLANHYMRTGQLDKADHYINLHRSVPPDYRTPIGRRAIEIAQYKLDSIRGNLASAFKHYQICQRMIDSGLNVTKAYQMSLLQIENDTEKKNQEIDVLNKKSLIKDNDLKRNLLIQKVIIAGTLMLAIITALIYSRYRLKQRSNTLLMQQKSEIDQQNIELQFLVNDKNELIVDKDVLLKEKDGLLLDKDVLLKDKDLLIKEVNHRVKNNLQIVMSLLQSQSGYLKDKQAQEAILEGQNRVQCIALIHDQLFRSDHATEVDLPAYIGELVDCLNYSINKGSHKVEIGFDIDPIMLDVSQAIPMGIILNEAVTNALKYAFPGERTGKIWISVKECRQIITIRISDNGAGLPSNFTLEKVNSLGMTLIKGLAGQLDGTFEIIDNNGVNITIEFPMSIPEAALAVA
ncbi:hypothetical protein FPZ43_14190 [Mucilaginibacter pallidiroseus]|uniref:histidine kinase n=1 Tax=Mucilaginibacter pallidiroseus TaxID=2599295 RepID=A0A563U4R3_9SPHI|nr:histidine kinase dimerization/phosphoacceptor domain -containing protein [Mucilaginibacter pallidiroseus]TWR26312.1 hypothetical protein FPZ43_14190 [Mucilaginibacter pallidiroseus]